jgi:hypothetical protein
MDNQPILTQTPGMYPAPSRAHSPFMILLVVFLGVGTILFGILTITFYDQAQSATNTLNAHESAAATNAKNQQKKTDALAYSIENESPFRSFTAPDLYGSFVINFPKDWSSTVDEEQDGTQVSLALNPDFVQTEDGVAQPVAARVMLIDQPESQYMSQFTSQVQQGMLSQAGITVSGQTGFDLRGQFNDQKTVREVVIPVRDKVLVFTTENSTYATEFDQILAQCKINP